ncbi:helix-turn-helix domain-containing protein [Streptomyces populi]|uniref:helix-turn-helix domain-containing protein n=1 Tax=Streptomyces populi TaxID=2058924 RepID=UPI003B845C6D
MEQVRAVLERVGVVVERVTGVSLSRATVWRLLTGRLGWSLQRPERRAGERDESEIARWVAHEWPRIKGGGEETCLDRGPRRIRCFSTASGPPHLRTPRPHSESMCSSADPASLCSWWPAPAGRRWGWAVQTGSTGVLEFWVAHDLREPL